VSAKVGREGFHGEVPNSEISVEISDRSPGFHIFERVKLNVLVFDLVGEVECDFWWKSVSNEDIDNVEEFPIAFPKDETMAIPYSCFERRTFWKMLIRILKVRIACCSEIEESSEVGDVVVFFVENGGTDFDSNAILKLVKRLMSMLPSGS
jgi:hypothetical protein